MKKSMATIICLATAIFAGNASAQDSIGPSSQSLSHSGQSIIHSAQAVGQGSMAGAKLTSGVVAIPLKVTASVSTTTGQISRQVGEDLWDTASDKPLELTNQNFIKAGLPPHEAIQD